MNDDYRKLAGQVRRLMDAELRALRSRDVWAYVTAVWPLLDRVLSRWVAFVTPCMTMPNGADTVLRVSIRHCIERVRKVRAEPEESFDSRELYVVVVSSFVSMAPLLACVQARFDDGSLWTPRDGPLGLQTRFAQHVEFIWHSQPLLTQKEMAEILLDAITDDQTRPLTSQLITRIREAA